MGSQNTEESVIMGIDVHKGAVTIGFILPIYQDMVVKLDGDGCVFKFQFNVSYDIMLFFPEFLRFHLFNLFEVNLIQFFFFRGFKLATKDSIRLFKPVSVQALWAAHQAIILGCKVAQQNDYHPKGPSHAWISYYTRLPSSKQFMMFEWNKMEDIEDMGRATPPSTELGFPISEDE